MYRNPSSLVFLFSLGCILGRPEGPPVPEACVSLRPLHDGTSPSPDPSPASLSVQGVEGAYVPGATLSVNLTSSREFRGFMLQVRSVGSEEPLGTFSIGKDNKSQTLMCFQDADSVSHANSTPVMAVNSIQWSVDTLPADVTQIAFYYTVVEEFMTYWVQLRSESIPVAGSTALPTSEGPTDADAGIPLKQAGVADILVRLHGSLMAFTWGFLAPVGIMLALFYKVVWPNGQWFYAHIVLMVLTLVLSLLGVIPIVVHADGLWLTTTSNNLPHQILGITALVAVGGNPFLAICRCYPSSPWRWVYNTIHGSIGLILGEGAAFGAMLLGLHILRELGGVREDYVHYAIYSMSGTIGLIIMIAALFNIYAINYQKSHPALDDLGVTSEPPTEFLSPFQKDREEDEEDEESEDMCCRGFIGILIILVLLCGAAANITLLVLL